MSGMATALFILFENELEKNPNKILSPDQLDKQIEDFFKKYPFGPLSEDDKEAFCTLARNKITVSIEPGATLVDASTTIPWVNETWKRLGKQRYYWDSYQNLLRAMGRSSAEVSEIDSKTDEILDCCGNPAKVACDWHKRGLVIGEVQSGKTALFTGLISKAADAGYKVIVVLTGTLEKLRKQTQSRLDHDFVGRSSKKGEKFEDGVAKYRTYKGAPVSLTSFESDFKTSMQSSSNFQLNSLRDPLLLVVKKNKTVLNQLCTWLGGKNGQENGGIPETLFVVDDEADNASINTNTGESPTAINDHIRRLLGLFRNSTYVGFTATPFANVFIDPDQQDLFPSDFISCMGIPSIYFSVYKMLDTSSEETENNKYASALQEIPKEETEQYIPLKHKKNCVPKIPPSLKEAIRQFFIANVIRDLRGQGKSHRSMLINVSRLISVQNRLKESVAEYVGELKDTIQAYASSEEAESSDEISNLRTTFDNYKCTDIDWETVKQHLFDSICGIKCYVVNQKNSRSLDYDANKEDGLRAIVIGGQALSRGYTLEGLCVSYLYRTTAYYDTLMQMGRWFGYRIGYEDLCRIWMLPKTISFYEQIARATNELREDINRMISDGSTPQDFGLKVRESPDALLITCRNKMKNSAEFTVFSSFNAYYVETPTIEKCNFDNNLASAQHLIEKISASSCAYLYKEEENRFLYRDVPKELVAEFISNFKTNEQDLLLRHFDDDENGLANFILNNDIKKLQKWDVLVWGVKNKENILCDFGNNISVGAMRRSIRNMEAWNNQSIFQSARGRIGGVEVEYYPLDKEEVKLIRDKLPHSSDSSKHGEGFRLAVRYKRERPLLVLMPVVPQEPKSGQDSKTGETKLVSNEPIVTYAISFCGFDEKSCNSSNPEKNKTKYKVNKVWLANLRQEEAYDLDGDEDEEV